MVQHESEEVRGHGCHSRRVKVGWGRGVDGVARE